MSCLPVPPPVAGRRALPRGRNLFGSGVNSFAPRRNFCRCRNTTKAVRNLKSRGEKLSGLFASGFAVARCALLRRRRGNIATSASCAACSPTMIRSRSPPGYWACPRRRGRFASANIASFSTKRRILTPHNFTCCSSARARWRRTAIGSSHAPIRRSRGDSPWSATLQQSIYSNRADLAHYQSIRDLLREERAGGELSFTTTFRCDRAIVDFVNETFPRIFNEPGQVRFVPLEARPRAGSGQVVRFTFDHPEQTDPKYPDRSRAGIEADALAEWIAGNGLTKLRARSWSEVAILVPQKRWFSPLRIALRKLGLHSQLQSRRDIKGESPAYAWLTALVMIAAEPRNHFEIFGVLRELFGISDDELAHFSAARDVFFALIARRRVAARWHTRSTCSRMLGKP